MKPEPRPVHELPLAPQRPADSHKGSYGRVLVVAGSPGMLGAGVLTARAALRSGSGLVTAAVPASLTGAFTAAVPEATQLLLPDPESPSYGDRVRDALAGAGAFQGLAIGPGIGTGPTASELLEQVLSACECPHVIDADGLNLVARGLELGDSQKRVWTPHPGEFRRLAGILPAGDDQRVRAAGDFVEARGGTLLLKGHRSVVHDGERFYINLTGNAGMATGGSGDVLTGIIASFLGQGLDPFSAACLGAYLHGLAGDLAARSLGPESVTAGDLVDFLPRAFTNYRGYCRERRGS